MLKIDKGVPVPGRGKRIKEISWDELEPGDSVLVPLRDATPKQLQSSLTQAARKRGLSVETRRGAKGVRMWLLARPDRPAAAAAE